MLDWIKYAIVGAFVVGAVAYHVTEVEEAKASVRQEYQLAAEKQEKRALETTGEILIESKVIEDKKNEEILRITNFANNLSNSLSKRPTRIEQVTTTTSVESSCTGRELFKEDGEFLIREAARADTILEERNYYYEQYEQARKKLNEFNRAD